MLKFPGYLFFLISPAGKTHAHTMQHPRCNMNNVMHAAWHHASHCVCHIVCAMCITLLAPCASHCWHRVHHIVSTMCVMSLALCACASRWWGRCSGKISAPENITYSGPEKCWKSLNILITSLTQNMMGTVYIFWTVSILEYLWNCLNIPGIFLQYSAFEYFLFTVITWYCVVPD